MSKKFMVLVILMMMTLSFAIPAFATIANPAVGLGLELSSNLITADDTLTVTVKAYDIDKNLTTIDNNVTLSDGVGTPIIISGIVDSATQNYINTKVGTYTLTVSSAGYSPASAQLTVTPGAFGGLAVDVPESMKVNERKPITIKLTDRYGNLLTANTADKTINFYADRYMEGKFYTALHGESQSPISQITVPSGAVSATVYYQPLGVIPGTGENGYINSLSFSSGSITTDKTITILPAGASFLRQDVDNWGEQVVSNASDPHPIKVTYIMFDQYNNLQTATQATNLALDYNKADGFVKLYADAACRNEITNSILTIPVGQVSASVYVISTKSTDYTYYEGTDGYDYEYVDAKLPGMNYTERIWLHFYPDKAVKMSFSANPDEIVNTATALKNQEIPVYLSAWDKFGNKTFYYDRYLTADLSSSPVGGYFYDDNGKLISQITVQNGYGKPIGQWWWSGMYFASSTAGPVTISASVPGLTVEPMTVNVSSKQFEIGIYGNESFKSDFKGYYAIPEQRVEIWKNFYGDVKDYTLTYNAYTLNGEVKTPVGKFYEGYSSGVETTTDDGDYNIYYEVPANLAEGTEIYIEGTSASLGYSSVTSLVVRKNVDWGKYLDRGWNILSTPFALASGNDTLSSVITNDEYIQVAYGYKNGQWYQMTNATPSTLSINPLESYLEILKKEW